MGTTIGAGAVEGGGGGTGVPKKKKKNKKKKKIKRFRAKINHQVLLVQNVFFWTIMLITPEINIIDYQFSNLTSWSPFFIEKDKTNKIKHISHFGLCLFADV